MPKLGMEPIRRRQLIQATMEAIDEAGLADATVARIARRAGVSAGIISHYFGGKDGLLEATMRKILGDLGEAVSSRRAKASDTPRAHIRAIIDGNFDRSQVSQSVMKTWLAFWASSMHRNDLQRLQYVNDRRLYSNLCYQFRRCLPRSEARDAARGLAALIDGLWLRGALAPEGLDVDRARRLAYDYLDEQLARAECESYA
ncbi:transcriptional regulator BetI [Modicisalibacter xianhensis]|uniref:HTH-type transcriptional regulator BetI n=1 Tax=Modicisalibacter xianhensis TaxID=442341 RepID=A0A1I3CUT8_9GAMM|nr:transcriptional regulator BetI [Halomonas xianhensis]TDX32319.1 TetR family transcriptional regulator [Halomonas xianhensis]SFH78029.1 transcriptional regulator, TetR family [Halomonas xianhensis]